MSSEKSSHPRRGHDTARRRTFTSISFPIPERAQRHPFSKSFEPPRWKMIVIHILMCMIAYPLLTIFTVMARGRTLFWTRLIISLGCGLVGFSLGLSLLTLGRAFLEAATWATVIHQSRTKDAPGIKLKDLAASSKSASIWAAFHLLWDRQAYPGTAWKQRMSYDRRPWSLFIIFFLLIFLVATSAPFVLGRLVAITVTVQQQQEEYEEIAVSGDSSDEDISHASSLKPIFEDFALTWTLSPFSEHSGLPPIVAFQHGNDTVYFSETILNQLLPKGNGFGTFNTETLNWALSEEVPKATLSEMTTDPARTNVEAGSRIRLPKWGTRLHCASIPDLTRNLVPKSPNGITYVFTPTSVLQALLRSFSSVSIKGSFPPFDPQQVLQLNDTIPPTVDVQAIATGAGFFDNGVAHSFFSVPMSMGEDGNGWMTIEHVVVRLNTTYTPNGTFPVLSDESVPDASGKPTRIGYDAAVCMQLFEPWIVEVYNTTTGVPSSVELLEKGNIVRSLNNRTTRFEERQVPGSALVGKVNAQLNSSRLMDVYTISHTNGINQLLKDNGRDAFYVPSQTVISFTSGFGAFGYRSLSPSHFAQARGMADATNILPYFAGSGQLLARRYRDRLISNASIEPTWMLDFLVFVLVIGLVAAFFVPRLPLNVPRRGFEVYTWMAAFHARELVGTDEVEGMREKGLELDEIEKVMGELKFTYANHRLLDV